MIPQYLYRGDSDPKGVRDLKATISHNHFQTNLINGGEGRLIKELPLENLINRHVGYGWDKTHFLSFSEDMNTALRFGIGCTEFDLAEQLPAYTEYYGNKPGWLFALLEFNASLVRVNMISAGVYECVFPTDLAKFNILGIFQYRVILINVALVLMNSGEHEKYADSVSNALRDKEWLLLPAVPVPLNFRVAEYSGILDGHCFSNVTRYSTSHFDNEGSFMNLF